MYQNGYTCMGVGFCYLDCVISGLCYLDCVIPLNQGSREVLKAASRQPKVLLLQEWRQWGSKISLFLLHQTDLLLNISLLIKKINFKKSCFLVFAMSVNQCNLCYRCFLGQNVGPDQHPNANRYMEVVVSRLCEIHPLLEHNMAKGCWDGHSFTRDTSI